MRSGSGISQQEEIESSGKYLGLMVCRIELFLQILDISL